MAAERDVKALLGQYLRVTVTDGRVLIGKLACIDAFGNTVLFEAEELPASSAVAASESRLEAARRWIGPISIKSEFIVKAEADSALFQQS